MVLGKIYARCCVGSDVGKKVRGHGAWQVLICFIIDMTDSSVREAFIKNGARPPLSHADLVIPITICRALYYAADLIK